MNRHVATDIELGTGRFACLLPSAEVGVERPHRCGRCYRAHLTNRLYLSLSVYVPFPVSKLTSSAVKMLPLVSIKFVSSCLLFFSMINAMLFPSPKAPQERALHATPARTPAPGPNVVQRQASTTEFSPPPMPTGWAPPTSCNSRGYTYVNQNGGTYLVLGEVYYTFQGSRQMTAGTECSPPGWMGGDATIIPGGVFYYSPGVCPSGWTDAGGDYTLYTSSVNYYSTFSSMDWQSFCCPR